MNTTHSSIPKPYITVGQNHLNLRPYTTPNTDQLNNPTTNLETVMRVPHIVSVCVHNSLPNNPQSTHSARTLSHSSHHVSESTHTRKRTAPSSQRLNTPCMPIDTSTTTRSAPPRCSERHSCLTSLHGDCTCTDSIRCHHSAATLTWISRSGKGTTTGATGAIWVVRLPLNMFICCDGWL
jgi:hypothetical protein